MVPRRGQVLYLLAGAFHHMAYLEWGDPTAPVVVCVHGLTRNAHDFDPLARDLARDFRVICPDLPGRGASVWLPDPAVRADDGVAGTDHDRRVRVGRAQTRASMSGKDSKPDTVNFHWG